MPVDHVVFSHGLESGPWGTKIQAMAETARAAGAEVASIDYQGMREPQPRVDKLLAALADLDGRVVLVGSSMGGHVATAAAQSFEAAGVFVLAPAFHVAGYEEITPGAPNDEQVEDMIAQRCRGGKHNVIHVRQVRAITIRDSATLLRPFNQVRNLCQ